VESSNFWLNSFPHLKGISITMSPREIVTRMKVDYNAHCKYEFREYIQTHEEHDNGMATWTVGALACDQWGMSKEDITSGVCHLDKT
jgi:hypothetical protein